MHILDLGKGGLWGKEHMHGLKKISEYLPGISFSFLEDSTVAQRTTIVILKCLFRVHGDIGDFRVVLFMQNCLRICQKYFSVHVEYALKGENNEN